MYHLSIIITSTRPGRKGPAIANWFYEIAKKHKEFNVELIDLAEVNLPFLDEPNHPRFQKYEHQHTKDWSARVSKADAYVFILAEYNFGYPAPLKNAMDFVFNEWGYKPLGMVSYGGVAAGTRAVQQIKLVATAQKMMPMMESVNIPFFAKLINEQGVFVPDEGLNKSADGMLTELLRWTKALKPMREGK